MGVGIPAVGEDTLVAGVDILVAGEGIPVVVGNPEEVVHMLVVDPIKWEKRETKQSKLVYH